VERVEFFYAGDEALQEKYAADRKAGADFIASVNGEDVGVPSFLLPKVTVETPRISRCFLGTQT